MMEDVMPRMDYGRIWDAAHQLRGRDIIAGPGNWTPEVYAKRGERFLASLIEAVGPLDGMDVLDFGCGDGGIALPVSKTCKSLVCADASEVACQRCREYVSSATVLRADKPSGIPGEFDIIYCIGVLYHLPDVEQYGFLMDFSRMLRPGGLLVADYCNLFHPFYVPVLRGAAAMRSWDATPPWVPVSGEALVHVATLAFGLTLVEHRDPKGVNPMLVLRR